MTHEHGPIPAAPLSRTHPPGEGLLTRRVVAWATYEWGSAAFNAVITTFVFTVYLTSEAFGDQGTTGRAVALGMGLAGLVIALLAPVTGQHADATGRTTFWLGAHTAVVVAASYGLFFVRPDPAYLWLGVSLLAVGTVFQELATVPYNALLNRVSTPRNVGRVSAIAWGVGYVGGITLLFVLYVGFLHPDGGWFGVSDQDGMPVRVSMLVAATWFAVSTLPVLIVMRRRRLPAGSQAGAPPASGVSPAVGVTANRRLHPATLVATYRQVWRTITVLHRDHPHTLRFLIASAVFRDGLAGVFTFSMIVAVGSYGFTQDSVLMLGIAANVVAGIATIASGPLDDRVGPKRVMVVSLVGIIVAGCAVFALQGHGTLVFWTVGLVLVVFVGPAQSASRSFLARVIPPGHDGELFGLYTMTGRAISFLAPLVFGLSLALGERIVGPAGDVLPWGILGMMLILLVGLILLLPVQAQPAADASAD